MRLILRPAGERAASSAGNRKSIVLILGSEPRAADQATGPSTPPNAGGTRRERGATSLRQSARVAMTTRGTRSDLALPLAPAPARSTNRASPSRQRVQV